MSSPLPARRGDAPDDAEVAESAGSSGAVDQVLTEVLRATLKAAGEGGQATPQEIEALREVARRHRQTPLTLDPTGIELVEAIINVNYGPLGRPPEVWRDASVRIASLLFESPTAHARLENLWHRLLDLK